jgi:Protein of unknown function (DUF2635)
MKVRIAEGRALRDPVTKTLYQPGEVRDVPESLYWVRRLRDGDCERVDKPAAAHHRATHAKE